MIKRTWPVLVIVIACFSSCYYDKEEILYPAGCSVNPVSYATDVQPIILTNCSQNSGCHGSGSFSGPGPLLNYNDVKESAAEVRDAVVTKRMPQVGSLTKAQIQTISCWVDAGAPNN
jgi:mono/diheme cytochrome c family protein